MAGAAADRPWQLLTNCHYIANAENDGDSFRVRSDTNEFLLRLYFVDAPETNLRYPDRTREQSEYFGITLEETMKGGRTARDLVRATLQEPFTVWTRHGTAGGRRKEPRYYGFVLVGTNGLDEILVRSGLARPKGIRPNLPTGQKAAAHNQELQALEAGAKAQKIGLWAGSASKTASPEPGQL
jgi:endonuclease YncB( thermonuclease family)